MCAHEWNCQVTACITLVRLNRDRFVSRRATPIRPPTSQVCGVPDTLEEELSFFFFFFLQQGLSL